MRRTLVLVAMLLLGCGKSASPSGAAPGGGGGKPKGPAVVRVVEVKEEVTERVVEITGTLAGSEEVTVSAEVEGRVEKVAADLGDSIQRGGLLVQLQATQSRLLAEQAEAEYLQALAKLGVDDAGLDKVDPATIASVKRAEADLE